MMTSGDNFCKSLTSKRLTSRFLRARNTIDEGLVSLYIDENVTVPSVSRRIRSQTTQHSVLISLSSSKRTASDDCLAFFHSFMLGLHVSCRLNSSALRAILNPGFSYNRTVSCTIQLLPFRYQRRVYQDMCRGVVVSSHNSRTKRLKQCH